MIKLDLEEYCHHGCKAFEPVAETQAISNYVGETIETTTVIQCEHKGLCRGLVRYLLNNYVKDYKGEEN